MPSVIKNRYTIELLCDYPQWWRYNIYIMAVGFDGDGVGTTFNNFVDKVYDTGYVGAPRSAPEGFSMPRAVKFETDECAFIDLYIYIVANTFPSTNRIGDWPPFPVTLRVSAGGIPVEIATYEVNQWGGLTVAGHRVDALAP